MEKVESDQGLHFGPYHITGRHGQVWRRNRPLALSLKAVTVLWTLAHRAGHLVSKEELFTAVWPETVVSEGVLTNAVGELRRALGDNAKAPRYIETVHRVGYRFIAPLTTTAQPASSSKFQVPLRPPPRTSQGKPLPPPNLEPGTSLVGREAELAQLHQLFEKALNGARQVVFVTGEAGIGKTALIDAFRQRLEARDWSLASASQTLSLKSQVSPVSFAHGQCIEQYGAGEAYLPILEALGRLGRGPQKARLLAVLQQYAPTWLAQLPALLGPEELEMIQRRIPGATRERMLREITEAFDVLTAEHPLVLVLEDLHWSDPSTVELLTMLARRREPARLLVVGAYRAAELAVANHPLRTVKQELVGRGHATEIALSFLSPAAVREYVSQHVVAAADIDSLADVVYQRTDGLPLFMVQVMDYLVHHDGPTPQSPAAIMAIEQILPQGLREMIEAQLGCLTEDEQGVLAVGSVNGAEFTMANVAVGIGKEELALEEICNRLVRQGQFIEERGVKTWPDGTVSGSYGFRHALYQEVLYTRIPEARRMRWHKIIGERLEGGYEEQTNEVAAELAMHFERGRDPQRAVQYFSLAVKTALDRSAYQEANFLTTRALELLKLWPDTQERIQQELSLRLRFATILMATKGYASAEVEEAFARTRLLCQQGGSTAYLLPALRGLWAFDFIRGDILTAHTLAQQVLALAQVQEDAVLLLEAHQSLGHTLFIEGELVLAQEQLHRSMSMYDPEKRPAHLAMYGRDPKVVSLSYEALILAFRGFGQQALQCCAAARAQAEAISHPFSQVFALLYTARTCQSLRHVQATQEWTHAGIALSSKYGFQHWQRRTETLLDWLRTEQTPSENSEFLVQKREWTKRAMALGSWVTYEYAFIAEAYGRFGHAESGLAVVQEGLAIANTRGERFYEAELYRLKGELTLQKGTRDWGLGVGEEESQKLKGKSQKSKFTNPQPLTPDPQGEAEACFLTAIEVARRQQAKSLELRAATSLARLWQQQGKKAEAHKFLSEIYNWFTEGFDTKDLQEAKGLLEGLR